MDSAQGPGTVIDMIAVGMHPKETPLLSHLASETGGILLLRKGKSSPKKNFFGLFLQ